FVSSFCCCRTIKRPALLRRRPIVLIIPCRLRRRQGGRHFFVGVHAAAMKKKRKFPQNVVDSRHKKCYTIKVNFAAGRGPGIRFGRGRQMQKIERQYIDWEKTGRNLQLLRADNLTLRKNVSYAIKYAK